MEQGKRSDEPHGLKRQAETEGPEERGATGGKAADVVNLKRGWGGLRESHVRATPCRMIHDHRKNDSQHGLGARGVLSVVPSTSPALSQTRSLALH